ncbi:MAG: TonB-dependent receptor [Bacteroidetes bacterium]|nr:TonB-dependent receptor [Bacteroidota bacterium]
MKRINTLILISLLINFPVFSQIITVLDSESGAPLDMVTLSSNDPNYYTITNAKGQADISRLRDAKKIDIRLIGYKTEAKSYSELEGMEFVFSLHPTAISLDQLVVSATRWEMDEREVPAKILTISAKEIAMQNPQTAADLLGNSGEIFIQKSQQGGGSPMIRGFSTNRLLYTVDGVRMNTAIFRSGNLQNVISLDPFAMENAEVIFGPVSLIYGSDAIGGVMSFQTLMPRYSLTGKTLVTGNAIARYSSANNEMTGHFHVKIGWKKWASVTSFSSNHFGDLRMGSYGPDDYLRPWYVQRQDSTDVVVTNDDPEVQKPTGYNQVNLMQKVGFKPSEHWEFVYGFHYSATTEYSRYDRLIRKKNGLPRSAEWYYGPQIWMMNNLTVTNKSVNTVYDHMTLRLAQQYFEESRIDRDYRKSTRYNRLEEVYAYSANLDFGKTLGSRHVFYYGLEAVVNDVNSTGTDEDISTGIFTMGPSRYPQSTWSSYAAYLSYQFKISEKLLAQAGLRYNQFVLNADFTDNLVFYPFPYSEVEINDGALTGNLGIVYNPTEQWAIVANASTGFRSPNVDDLGKVFDSEPGAVVVPNPDLKAEYAWNMELGVSKVFGEYMRIDVTGYYTLLDDAMVRRDYTLNGLDSIMYDGEMSRVQAIQNASQANVYGIQAGVEINLPQGFGLTSQFNYQKGEEELDDGSTSPLRHAAPWFGITHLTFNASKLTLDLYAIYNGEVSYENLPEEERGKDYLYAKDINGNPYSPAWYTLNLKAGYQITDVFSVFAGVENLTDQRYRPYSSGISAPGRNFMLTLKASF